jgi:hypothetical protein
MIRDDAGLGLPRLGDGPLRSGGVVLRRRDRAVSDQGGGAVVLALRQRCHGAGLLETRVDLTGGEPHQDLAGAHRAAHADTDLGDRAADERGDGGAANGADGADDLGHDRAAGPIGFGDLHRSRRHAGGRVRGLLGAAPGRRRQDEQRSNEWLAHGRHPAMDARARVLA